VLILAASGAQECAVSVPIGNDPGGSPPAGARRPPPSRLYARGVRLVLVTGNAHKVAELAHALPGWQVEGLRLDVEPDETGETYVDNARIKARAGRAMETAGGWVVGEDSGIEVAALGGAPGVRSARWAGSDGVGRLLEALDGAEDRRARYVCAIVALAPTGEELVVEGTLDGAIALSPRGSEGFGFDPVFVPVGEERTVAELGAGWKADRSHRAAAAAALAAALADA
jgi:XTP/dITP diphosphohydrolase